MPKGWSLGIHGSSIERAAAAALSWALISRPGLTGSEPPTDSAPRGAYVCL